MRRLPDYYMWRGQHRSLRPGMWLYEVAPPNRLTKTVHVRSVSGREFAVSRYHIRRVRPTDFQRRLI